MKESATSSLNRAQTEEGGNGGTVQQRGQRVQRKHTSGEVFVAVDSNLGADVGAEEGTNESIPGRIAQALVNVRGGLRIFSVVDPIADDGVWAIIDDGCNSCCHGEVWRQNAEAKM